MILMLGEFSLILTLVAVTTIVLLFWIYARYKLSYWTRRGVEQLSTFDLIFGNFKDAFLFRTAPGWHIGVLHRAARKDAPYVGFYVFHKPCILLRDPEIIKQIMIRDFENFSDRHFAGSQEKDSIGMKNLFGIRNPAWRYLRSKISPTLFTRKIREMFPLMLETGQPMMQYLKDHHADAKGVKLVDVQELSYTYATDLFASVALGTKMDSFNDPNADFMKGELVDLIGSTLLSDFKFVHKIFWSAVEKREKTGTKRGDFIDSLVQLKNGKQNDVYKFEGDNLLYQSGTFFPGLESSSLTVSFTLMELANHPEHQKRVREDIERSIKKHGWTYEAFKDMKYLDQTLAEGIRMHPPLATIDRYTREDYTIPGTNIVLEKGTPIFISLYGLHNDERFFEQPQKFNPERFNEGTKISDAYMPFGIGPRMCVGMKLGQLHAKIVMAMVLLEYELSQCVENTSGLDPQSTFTVAADGILLDFKKLDR